MTWAIRRDVWSFAAAYKRREPSGAGLWVGRPCCRRLCAPKPMADDMGRVLFRVVCNPFRVGSRFGEVPVASRGLPLAIFCQPFGLNRTPPRQSCEPVRWPQLCGGSPPDASLSSPHASTERHGASTPMLTCPPLPQRSACTRRFCGWLTCIAIPTPSGSQPLQIRRPPFRCQEMTPKPSLSR